MLRCVWWSCLCSPDPDPPSDRGGALAGLLPRRGSLLPPSARGLLPGRSGQTQEDLWLEPQTRQPRPPHRPHHPVPAAEAAPSLLPSAGREGGVPASAEKVDDPSCSQAARRQEERSLSEGSCKLQRLISNLSRLNSSGNRPQQPFCQL